MIPSSQLAPSLSRRAAIVLVLVQCATLGLLEGGWFFATIMGALAILSLVNRLRIEPRQMPHWFWFGLLAVVLAVKHRFAPESLNEQITFFNTVVGYEASRFLIFVQVTQLFVRRPGGMMPTWLAGVACLSMVLGSNVRLSSETQTLSMLVCLGFVGALALFSAQNRRRSTASVDRRSIVLSAIVLAIALFAGQGTSELFRRFEGRLERWLADHSGLNRESDVSPGFSGRGDIGDIAGWKQHASDRAALRIHADEAPGYLRGMVFDELRGSVWAESAAVRALGTRPAKGLSVQRSGELLYQLHPRADDSQVGRVWDVWPDALTGERMFLPLDAAWLGTRPARITVNRNGLIARIGAGGPAPYTAWIDREPLQIYLSVDDRRRFLKLDDMHRAGLKGIAADVFADAHSTREKVLAVEQFFEQNFLYALSAQPVRGPDVVTDFLRRRQPAHCEYFASAGTLLLRAAGVPTRYVTGYVVTEHNPAGNYWVARRRDAHAWVEAYDDETNHWITVECTPSSGVPSAAPRSQWSNWWDARQQALRELLHRATQGGLRGLVLIVWEMVSSAPGMALIAIGAAALGIWRRRRAAARGELRSEGPAFPALLRALNRTDRAAGRLGYRRAAHETISSFAARLRRDGGPASAASFALADWYEDYVRVRYGTQDAAGHADRLRARLREFTARRRSG